ncbi:MAG: methyltransferase domain-containing protein [Acutalibacteraceae bacterium]|nr:methyltransferase domain-containing protein [Acutalibacteraceae bacterium]
MLIRIVKRHIIIVIKNKYGDYMDNNINLICPVCSKRLTVAGKSLICTKHHSFDIAKQGYVNLLPVQNKKSLHPGDTKEMLVARREFLNSGIYLPICNSVTEKVKKLTQKADAPQVVDIGCGEGYYTTAIKNAIGNCNCIGIDISKDAVKMACSRDKSIAWVVATAGCLPVADNSTNLITAMFSLISKDEYSRILKKGGYIVEVIAGNNHLIELKHIIYNEVFKQDKKPADIGNGFKEISREEQQFTFTLDNQQLKNLLMMTPHLWRIKKENREKLEQTQSLKLTAHYWIRVLEKN